MPFLEYYVPIGRYVGNMSSLIVSSPSLPKIFVLIQCGPAAKHDNRFYNFRIYISVKFLKNSTVLVFLPSI